jgi:hypothetical protein
MTTDAKITCVAISHAGYHAAIHTDTREKLAEAIELHSGERATALEGAPDSGIRVEGLREEKAVPGVSIRL